MCLAFPPIYLVLFSLLIVPVYAIFTGIKLHCSTPTMKSLLVFAFFSLPLLFGTPVNAERSAEPAVQAHARAVYQGGWALALAASETVGCPVEAPVPCQNNYTTLACCPGNQVCHINTNSELQYCCPTGPSTLSLLKPVTIL